MSTYSVEIKWGILFVLMQLAWMIAERLAGLHDVHIAQHHIYSNFVAIPAIAVYVFALLDKRRSFYGGYMTFKQGFISGLFITLVVTLLSPLTQYLTSEVISPEYFSNVIRHSVESGMMTQQQAEEYFNLKSYLMQVVIATPLMGLITTLIVAFFVRKNPPPDHLA
ncbi:MAG: DUF4199 domain-containing protein [Ignavibacteriaceae bacterium]|nr:DUF4199 domain-containing protein [Ignavibacteriaceae bacterium]